MELERQRIVYRWPAKNKKRIIQMNSIGKDSSWPIWPFKSGTKGECEGLLVSFKQLGEAPMHDSSHSHSACDTERLLIVGATGTDQ